MGKVNLLGVRILFLVMIIILPFRSGGAYSEIHTVSGENANLSARNFDFMMDRGFIRFSPAGIAKQAQYTPDKKDQAYSWTSKYSSVIFNAYFDKSGPEKGNAFYTAGVDGINTEGLKVGSYFLEDSIFPVPKGEKVLDAGDLLEYLLDNFKSVEEAVKDIESNKYVVTELPTNLIIIKLHFYLHDVSGASAIVEFLHGKVNIIRNPKISALTNLPYKASLSALRGDCELRGTNEMPCGNDAIARFVRAAYYLKKLPNLKDTTTAINSGFSIAQIPAVPLGFTNVNTKWTIVTDIKNRCVYFRTFTNPNIASINLKQLASRAKVASDIDLLRTDLTGDISNMFTTEERFSLATVPRAPNYGDKEAWAKLPSKINMKVADVFFVHPTTYFFPNSWNESIEFGQKKSKVADSIAGQASVFGKVCNIYAPHYRDAHIKALNASEESKNAALTIAYGDVERAFDYYLSHYNNKRPFILAGHSQGSELILWLLQKKFNKNTELQKKLIASYIIGWSVTAEDLRKYPYLKISTAPEEIGAIITYNTEGENPTKSIVQEDAIGVNPLTMDKTMSFVPNKRHLGAVFLQTIKSWKYHILLGHKL